MPENSASPPHERLAYLEGLVDALGGVVWEFDWSTGCFTYVSRAAEGLLGFTKSEWMAPGFWLERLHPDDSEWAPSYCVEATKDGRDHEFEYRMLCKDGREVWVYDLVSVDSEARMEGRLRGILLDITERKTAQAHAANRDEEFHAVFRVMQDAYFRVSPDDRVLSCEAPAGMLMLHAGETAAGRNLLDLFAPGSRTHSAAACRSPATPTPWSSRSSMWSTVPDPGRTKRASCPSRAARCRSSSETSPTSAT